MHDRRGRHRKSRSWVTYDGGEQYGAGHTHDNTYYGRNSYDILSPAATCVLIYSMPLKKLCVTGKDATKANWLSQQAAAAIASGGFDVDCKKMTAPLPPK